MIEVDRQISALEQSEIFLATQLAAVFALVALAATWVHVKVMPLDIAWIALRARRGM